MKAYYFLRHEYPKYGLAESKAIGIFSSEEKALEAIDLLSGEEGFRLWPDSFFITRLDLNQISWGEIKYRTRLGD